ncbi:response regulator transcription factor [Myxococcota bacterium]|nr:response regulator transcription factor [Myxococcota bacterium]
MTATILLVEDELDLVRTLEYSLQREGYVVRSATTGKAAMDLLSAPGAFVPDLVLLDLMLPDMAGTEICRRIRAHERTRNVPVIILTAKTEEIDRVVGFEVGADDYVTKPFSVRELSLRIRAILRRAHVEPGDTGASVQSFGRLRADGEAHRVWVDDQELRLTALEFRLLSTFMARRGRVQTRETLLSDVWGIQADVTTRTVDTHVKRLREKLGAAGEYVETVRGVGYRWRSVPDAPGETD